MRFLPVLALFGAAAVLAQDSSSAEEAVSVTTTASPTTSEIAASTTADATASSTASSLPDPDDDPETRCRQNAINSGVFCSPKPGDEWQVDGKYYVRWDSDKWSPNSTVYLVLNYETAGHGGKVIEEWEFSNARGFYIINPNREWLRNQTLRDKGETDYVDDQRVYFTITSNDAKTPGARNPFNSIVFSLVPKPSAIPIDTSPSNRPPPSFFGLAVGLPLVAGFIIMSVCGTHFCMKKQRQIGPISIGGGGQRFRRGYSGRQARRQRAAAAATGTGGATYRDDPDGIDDLPPPAPQQGREWELAHVKGGRV